MTPTVVKSCNNYNNNLRNKGGTQKFNKGNCHVCGKYGHFARDCRSNKNTRYEGKNNANRPVERTYMICTMYILLEKRTYH